MNAGKQTIEWLFNQRLRVDDEWSMKIPSGFGWWAAQNAQDIEMVGENYGPQRQTGYLISVRTGLLRDLGPSPNTEQFQ